MKAKVSLHKTFAQLFHFSQNMIFKYFLSRDLEFI